ncbi:hypothetical protein EV426DRAFT_24454 [Tirmania nivea]|nr:hypothetical protein EV426DRAFT_24454 [Tirmania nivea]
MVIPFIETYLLQNIILVLNHKKFSILYDESHHPTRISIFDFETSIVKCRRYQTVGRKITGPRLWFLNAVTSELPTFFIFIFIFKLFLLFKGAAPLLFCFFRVSRTIDHVSRVVCCKEGNLPPRKRVNDNLSNNAHALRGGRLTALNNIQIEQKYRCFDWSSGRRLGATPDLKGEFSFLGLLRQIEEGPPIKQHNGI